MDILKAIRVLAARAVENRDGEYIIRHLCRWWSKEFNTPYAEAEAIPLEDLLQHYFECKYEAMNEHELAEEVGRLIETDAERSDREKREADAIAADEAFYQEELSKSKQMDQVKTTLDKIPEHDNKAVAHVGQGEGKLPAAAIDKSIRGLPPDIQMSFIPENELEDIDSWDILGPAKKDDVP